MAVLVEAFSVIVKCAVAAERFAGGWEGFVKDVPNQTLCADGELARVGFMTPEDMQEYVKHLEHYGIIGMSKGEAVDVAVVSQLQGLMGDCRWLEVGHINVNGDPQKKLTVCRLVNSRSTRLVTPVGWQYEGSLSAQPGFVPEEKKDERLVFLRHENGVDVYQDKTTGKEVYTGRTEPKNQ